MTAGVRLSAVFTSIGEARRYELQREGAIEGGS